MMKNLQFRYVSATLLLTLFCYQAMAAGWCGESKKEDCGNWVVQMAVFNGGAMGSNDCVSYNGCVTSAQWDWSNTGAWSQLLLEKEGFCGNNYRISNTADFNVSYNGSFTGAWGNHRLAIVSWAKTTDDCDWRTDNLYELYIHERSYNEGSHVDAYDSWCIYKGTSPSCSGSTYELYDCEYQILGRSIRCWRNNARTSGTTDIDCLWEAWRDLGIAPDVYYYFTEVGAEVGPDSGGRFNLDGNNMTRTAGGGSSVYLIKNKATGLYMRPDHTGDDASIYLSSNDGSNWFKWEKVSSSDGYFYLKNKESGKYFRPANGNDGSTMQQKSTSWNGTWTQWKEVTSSDGSNFHFQNRATGKYIRPISSSNTNVELRPNSWSGDWTRWSLEGTSARQVDLETEISEELTLNIYPNPTSDLINIEYDENYQLGIYNINGALMLNKSLDAGKSAIELTGLESGVYFVKLLTNQGSEITRKIIVR